MDRRSLEERTGDLPLNSKMSDCPFGHVVVPCGTVLVLVGFWLVGYYGPSLRAYQALEEFSSTRVGFSTGVVLIVGGVMILRWKG